MVKKRKRFGGNIPSDEAPVKRAGRPVSGHEHGKFEKLCRWLDLETEPYSELRQKMVELADGTEVYTSNQYLKQLLLKRYGNDIFFSEMKGISDVVCFKNVATLMMNDLHKTKSREIMDETRPISFNNQYTKYLNDEQRRKSIDIRKNFREQVHFRKIIGFIQDQR